jgi:hypothetical protein
MTYYVIKNSEGEYYHGFYAISPRGPKWSKKVTGIIIYPTQEDAEWTKNELTGMVGEIGLKLIPVTFGEP